MKQQEPDVISAVGSGLGRGAAYGELGGVLGGLLIGNYALPLYGALIGGFVGFVPGAIAGAVLGVVSGVFCSRTHEPRIAARNGARIILPLALLISVAIVAAGIIQSSPPIRPAAAMAINIVIAAYALWANGKLMDHHYGRPLAVELPARLYPPTLVLILLVVVSVSMTFAALSTYAA